MYIRKVESKLRDGTSARYVQLAHNFRDPKSNRSRAQVLYSFGREDQVDHEALKRLVSSIERFLSPDEALKLKAQRDTALEFKESRPLGGAWALQQLWTEIGIDRVIKKGLRKRSFSAPIERAIFAMVANRALAPKSKLSVESWANDDVCLPGVEDLQVQHLYRSLDVILDMEDKLQEEVFFSVSHLLNLEVDLLFFDTTSTYFEIEGEDIPSDPEDEAYVLRRQGYSKDSRPDLAQVVIGLAVTREGIPIRVWTWPGNTADVTRVKQVKEDLIGWKLGRVISVLDRGFMSEANLRELQKAGGHYIIGEKMQAGKPMVEEALSRAGRYQSVTHNVEVKELVVGDGEARKRYILVRNPEQQKKDEQDRQGLVERLQAELEAIKSLDKSEHSKAVCRLVSHPTYGRYLKLGKGGWPRLDKAKLESEKRLDGKYLLLTSDDTLPAADVALGYKQLLEVEDAFRTLKQTLELRPVYHRLSRRIRAHVVICWLALLLIRVAEVRAERAFGATCTWSRMRALLDRMHLGYFSGPNGAIRQRTETQSEQARLFEAIGVPEPPRFFQIDPRTNA
jgi:transposase